MLAIKKKYKASTLIEVIVAMIIVLICAGLGMTAFTNVNKDLNITQEAESVVYMNKVLTDTQIERDYTDKDFSFENVNIERRVTAYKNEKRLRIVVITAFNLQSKKTGEIKEVIMIVP
ncbi:MAG TPA: type II secretion system protein [Bacteroidales bacterium]|nr:type II secretion system protein [Bacteroidales bacterium]